VPLFNFKRKKKTLTLLILAIILILIFNFSFLPSPKPIIVSAIKFPIYAVNFIVNEVKALLSYRINYRKAAVLEKENESLKQGFIRARELDLENARLRKLLSFKQNTDLTTIAARVICRDASNWANSLIINKGLNDGIKDGKLVITELGLAGRVIDVSKNTSRVMLITDPNLNIAAFDQRSRETGVISGTLLGRCLMRYLASDSDIREGDLILTLGLDNDYEKGIVIGEVISVHKEEDGVSAQAIIRPKVKLSILEEVAVLK